jgi:hypothetical protein
MREKYYNLLVCNSKISRSPGKKKKGVDLSVLSLYGWKKLTIIIQEYYYLSTGRTGMGWKKNR